jgi:hypothetical protein
MSLKVSTFTKYMNKALVLFFAFIIFSSCNKGVGNVTVYTNTGGLNGVKTQDLTIGVYDLSQIDQPIRENHALYTGRFKNSFNSRYDVSFSDLLPGNYFVVPVNANASIFNKVAFQIKNGDDIEVEWK